MTHTDLILIISIITLTTAAGGYVIFKIINQYTPTPQNLLTRRGDIELNDYLVEPTRPLQSYYPREWLQEVSSCPPSYNVESVNGISFVPSQQAEIHYVNCCLENEYNLFILLITVTILIIIISIFIIIKNKTNIF